MLSHGKLGKTPATVDERDIKFSAIKAGIALPTPPANFGHGTIFGDGEAANDFQMNGNGPDDTVEPGFQGAGDCVWAAFGHIVRVWNKVNGKTVHITGKQSISDYSACTGYVLNDDSTDNGTDMRQAMLYWQKTGILDAEGNRHKIGAFVLLETLAEQYEASYCFGGSAIGFNFQQAQDDQFASGTWDYVAGSPDVGGHCVPWFGRNKKRGGVASWADHLWFTENLYTHQVDQAFAFVSVDELKNGKTERGMDLSQLDAALSAL